jgi:hypothetical protein
VDGVTDTQTDPTPNPVFSLDDSLETLWIKAYQAEILGEILFNGIADAQTDEERARQMRVLGKLEQCTARAMLPALERAGISSEPDPDNVALANALVEGTATATWEDILGSFGTITKQFSEMYERIGLLDPSEKETSEMLVAHEAALAAFGRLELAGEHETSLQQIEALPHLQ